jgi:thymidylate synthase
MHIVRETLDDVLLQLYAELLGSASVVTASRGEFTEVVGALIEIHNPRARLSRSETRGKLFSSLGELLWYLSRDNQLAFIERYLSRYRDESDDGVTVYGG